MSWPHWALDTPHAAFCASILRLDAYALELLAHGLNVAIHEECQKTYKGNPTDEQLVGFASTLDATRDAVGDALAYRKGQLTLDDFYECHVQGGS